MKKFMQNFAAPVLIAATLAMAPATSAAPLAGPAVGTSTASTPVTNEFAFRRFPTFFCRTANLRGARYYGWARGNHPLARACGFALNACRRDSRVPRSCHVIASGRR